MSSARVCLQWTLIIFNTISVALGVLAIIGTIYEYDKYATDNIDKWIQIVAGSVLILAGLVGCCAAASGSIKALWCFIIVLIALIAAHAWRLWRYNEQKLIADSEMSVTFNWIEELVKTGAMNQMQSEYKCCGKRGPNDYGSLSLTIPASCYNNATDSTATFPYTEGCMSAVRRAYLKVYHFDKWLHWALIVYEVLGIWLSVFLICTLSTKTRRYEY